LVHKLHDIFESEKAVDTIKSKSLPSIMLEYSSRCNLRCTYCPKSNPGNEKIPGRDMDMDDHSVKNFVSILGKNPLKELLIAGTGESTFNKNWVNDFPAIISAAKSANPKCLVHLNSNFARRYTEEELRVLSTLDKINVSIDTDDFDLNRTVRAKSSVADIMYNIIKLNSYCLSNKKRRPHITIVSVIYESAMKKLPSLLYSLATLPIEQIQLVDLIETPAAKVNNIEKASEILRISNDLGEQIAASFQFYKQNTQISLGIQPAFRKRLNQLLTSGIKESDEDDIGMGVTRVCTQPWSRFTIGANMEIYPCCVTDMESQGTWDNTKDLIENFNNPKIKRFRTNLISGDIPEVCKKCTNAPVGSAAELINAILPFTT